ncbi:hypothetical protein [Candidatus Nitrospira neomarina]|uniref:Uncharacterized protein n=1 Tax=Candidatus Nitrospira neomarina TaxID=3020899 RepID=A0AA96GI36_9BACT|nr:hypothetical protein [Candidatus Nitrospira neomarina]WNM62301.1 hypothetical protein PQG83_00730 [Candidatus Nitrospira neomarina]
MNQLGSLETGNSVTMKEEALPDNQQQSREYSHAIPSDNGRGKVPKRFLIKRHGRAGT